MPTSKQPRFPNPPLEVGVAQYPTPSIPDFKTRSGHIILVEKVSVEKGSYTPQKPAVTDENPTIYTGRDAKKWPEPLYLVFERPTEDGQFVYRIWANDRSLASQDPWNYGISYSSENPDYPIYTRVYTVPRAQYSPATAGSSDPIFGGNAKIVEQKMVELAEDNPLRSRHVLVQRVYEPIPGPVISSKSINKYGAYETTTDQIVIPTASPSDSGLLVSDQVAAVSALKSRQQRTVMDAHPPTLTIYSIAEGNAIIKTEEVLLLRSEITQPAITGAILDISDSDMGFPWVKRTTQSLPINPSTGLPVLPPTRTEYDSITYTFPGIIYTWKAKQSGETTVANLGFFNNRYPITMTVAKRVVISYHAEEQDLSQLPFFKVVTRPWAIAFFNLPDNTIHPPAPINLSSKSISVNGIEIQISGGQASDPTTYNPGDEILISGESKLWQGNIFMKKLEYVREPV